MFFLLNKYFFLAILFIVGCLFTDNEDVALSVGASFDAFGHQRLSWFDSNSFCLDFDDNMYAYNRKLFCAIEYRLDYDCDD